MLSAQTYLLALSVPLAACDAGEEEDVYVWWGRSGSKGAKCRTARNAKLREMPNCAKCRRAPNAEERANDGYGIRSE